MKKIISLLILLNILPQILISDVNILPNFFNTNYKEDKIAFKSKLLINDQQKNLITENASLKFIVNLNENEKIKLGLQEKNNFKLINQLLGNRLLKDSDKQKIYEIKYLDIKHKTKEEVGYEIYSVLNKADKNEEFGILFFILDMGQWLDEKLVKKNNGALLYSL